MSNPQCVDEVIYDPLHFPSTFLADKKQPLTDDNLQLSEYYISSLRNSEIPMKFDTKLFTELLSEIFSSNLDPLLKIRTALLVVMCKNYINISDIFNVLLTFDTLDSKTARDGLDNIFIHEGNALFNDTFFAQLAKNRMLILDTVDCFRDFMDSQERLQFDQLYPIMYKIIRTNDNLDAPLESRELNFDFIFSYKDKMPQDEYDHFVQRIRNEYPILLPLSERLKEYQEACKPSNEAHIRVSRENPLEAVFRLKNIQNIRSSSFYIKIDGEDAIDCGGVTKEFIELVAKELVKPENNILTVVNNFYWFPYYKTVDVELLSKYENLGIFFALVIKNKLEIPIRFPRYFFKKLLHRPISTQADLPLYLDPIVMQSYMFMINTPCVENEEFPYVYPGRGIEIDLSNFKDITDNPDYKPPIITDENKGSLLTNLSTWAFDKSISKIWKAFETGFYSVEIRSDLLCRYFRLDELDILFRGETKIDWSVLPDKTIYYSCHKDDELIQWFWQFFMQLDDNGKINAIKFITGKSTVPIGGIPDGFIKIRLDEYNQSNTMPKAHTCFNTLDLPNYPNYDELAAKCELGFASCEGFGFE